MASMILRSRFLATPASKMLWTSLTPTKMAAKHSALLLQVVQQRPLHTSYKVFFEAEKQPEQTEADGLCTEEHDRTIYQGILATQIKLVKSFSLLTSMIGISCQPVLMMQMQQNNAHLAIMAGAGIFLSFFTFATPILIHWISKKYVTELNYNKLDDTYTAVTYSLLLRRKEIKFNLQDVQVPDIPGMFTTFRAKNVPLFVDGSQFVDPKHFGKIMGYDKPLNLRWDHESDKTESQKNREEEESKQKKY